MDLSTLTLASAADRLRRREISCVELTDFFLARVGRYQPELDAFITITSERARAQAERVDAERARGIDRGPLHGIPLGLKDLFETRGVLTTAGSQILRDYTPAADAWVTTRLNEAGAVLLGKMNMHEWAYGVTNDNPVFGRAKNPWALDRVTGGSSGGSGAAVAARLCLGALGSDTGGSIRIPASLCGVTGIKPTYGRVSLRGVIPLSWSMDHAGPLAQTAQDCALLLQQVAGYDPADPSSVNLPVPDFVTPLSAPIRGLRFAAPRGYFEAGVDREVLGAVDQAARTLEELGAGRTSREMPFASEMFTMNRVVLRAEAAAYHQQNLATRPQDYGADQLARLQSAARIPTADYARGRRRQAQLVRELELYFQEVDFIIVPTTRVAAPRAGEDAVQMAEDLTAFTAPFNLTGVPAISLPCAFTSEGLPIGLQLVTRRWDEATLLRVAHHYQLVTDWHTRIPDGVSQ